MMNYENFKNEFAHAITESMADHGYELAPIEYRTVEKANVTYQAATIRVAGESIGMSVPVASIYEDYIDNHMPFEICVAHTIGNIIEAIENQPKFNTEQLNDYSLMQKKLSINVISAENNAALLKTIPHKMLEDMAIVYRFILDENADGQMSILLTNDMLLKFGITLDELHEDALKYAPTRDHAVLSDLYNIVPIPGSEEGRIYLASTASQRNGAGVILYPGFLEEVAKTLGTSYYMLPSSVHEFLLVPDTNECEPEELHTMVMEVNASEVSPEDKLTDSLYHYDANSNVFKKSSIIQQQKRKGLFGGSFFVQSFSYRHIYSVN